MCELEKQIPAETGSGTDNQAGVDAGLCVGGREE